MGSIEGGRRRYGNWITLRPYNIDYVSEVTGMSKDDLRRILRKNKDKGVREVQIPLGTKAFTREDR